MRLTVVRKRFQAPRQVVAANGPESAPRERWLPVLTAAVCLAPFAALLAPDDRVITDSIFCDYDSFQLPIREFAREEMLSGRFPLWIPYLGCGMPLHASQQASLCQPILTPFVLLLGANQGIKASLFIHLALAFAGCYRLARELSISRWGASLAAIVGIWGAFPVMHLMVGHVIVINEYAFVPWFFACLVRLLGAPSPRNSAFLAIVVGCMAVSGQPQILFYTLLFGFLWTGGSLVLGAAAAARLRAIAWAGVALACGALLGAAQLAPSLELARDGISQSQRGTAEYAAQHAMGAIDFVRLFVPNAFGNPFCELKRFDEVDFVHERCGYVGVLPLLLAGFGLTRRSAARWQWGAAALVLFGLAIGLGNNTPCFSLLGHAVPGLTLFRCPGRIFSVLTPLLAVLAGRGLDAWANREQTGGRRSAVFMVFAASLLLALIGFSVAKLPLSYRWKDYVEFALRHVAWEWIAAAATLLLAAFVVFVLPKHIDARWCYAAALIATLLDLIDVPIGNLSLERRTIPPAEDGLPRPSRRSPTDETAWEGHPPDDDTRVVDQANFQFWPGSLAGTPIVPVVIGARLRSVITNEGGVLPASLSRLHQAIEKTPSIGLALAGCNYACNRAGDVWEPLMGALARIRLVSEADRELTFKPIEEVDYAKLKSLRDALIGSATIACEDPQNLSLDVSSLDDAVLVVADLFYPGWECQLDGRSVAIKPAHGVFRAVAVPKGEHRVDFHYRPASFRIGVWCSLAGLLIAGLLSTRAGKREQLRPKT